MHNNDRLMPDQRTDKNGVTSTRWVLPTQRASRKASTSIPSISMMTVHPQGKSLPSRIAEDVSVVLGRSSKAGEFERNLEGLSDVALDAIAGAATDDPRRAEVIWTLGNGEYDEDTIVDSIDMFPVLDAQGDKFDTADYIERVHDLKNYPYLPDRATDPVARREQGEALVTAELAVHAAVRRNGKLGPHIAKGGKSITPFKDELGRLIADNPDKAHQIADALVERGVNEIDVIRGIVGNDAPALGDGFL